MSPVTRRRVAQRRRKKPVGSVSENTICLVLIPRLFASASLPRPSPWKRNTPTRLSEQKGEELRINLMSLSSRAETSRTERRSRGDARRLQAQEMLTAQRHGRHQVTLCCCFFSFFLFLKWLHQIKSYFSAIWSSLTPVSQPACNDDFTLLIKWAQLHSDSYSTYVYKLLPKLADHDHTHTQTMAAHNGCQLQLLMSSSGTTAYHPSIVYD